MLHTINPEILFLKQEDVIKAGLLDMKQILAVTEKTYAMLSQGLIKNPPKTNTSIPDKENWQSFFNAMPCYIGGDINIGGIKWAAESKKNATIPGIPYGIDISILSDPETVLPFCILDGTLITAMRTSAVGGLMAKYAAPSDADTACLVGAGVIGRTMISAVHEALPQIKTMYLCDIDVAKAEGIVKEYGDSLGVEIIPTSDSKAAALKSQLIVGETTAPKPFMDTSWLTPGCGLVSMHSNEVMEDVFLKADGIVADYWTQLKQHTNPLSKFTKEGKLDESQIMDLSELVLGTKKLRTSDDQFVAAASMGLGALDIMIGKGPSAQSIRINLPRFTLVGATTRAGQLTGPLRDRFGILLKLEPYSPRELGRIILRSAGILGVPITEEGALELARCARGTPRIANRMLKRVRDFATVQGDGTIDEETAIAARKWMDIDELGLDELDRSVLRAIIEMYGGGPVGLETLAAALGEESVTLEDICEPYLMQMGMLTRTPRGRCVTRLAYEHLHMAVPKRFDDEDSGQTSMF